jgi:acetoin utilization deacetylase AcuC-like enzyme
MHPDTGRHDTGWGHPEHQGRLPAILKAIERDTPALMHAVTTRTASPAPLDALARVHSKAHIAQVRSLVEHAAATGECVTIGGDTTLSAASWDAALAAAGCAIDAALAVLDETADSTFAISRPPGHHATGDLSMGFCLFNNVAVAARAAQAAGAGRILVVDWDVHHGNGTQDVFYEDDSVCYLSLHQHPWYPGTGRRDEHGTGRGSGTTMNVPLPAGTTADLYRAAFTDALDAVLETFTPDLVLVSAGYDCMAGDPLGRFELEPADLFAMASVVLDRARSTTGRGPAVILEGGYSPERVGLGVVATLRALSGIDMPD